MKQISRRTMLGTAAAMAATPAFAEGCQVGPPEHHKGPLVFKDYDQLELDASYDQVYYEPLIAQVSQRLSSNSDATRSRIGADFIAIKEAVGDLGTMAAQVRRGIAWVYKNAASFGGDPERIFIGGHSSGGHLCGVALVTDWQKDFGLPENIVKGGLCMSGMYDMAPVQLSWRRTYVNFTDAMADAMSAQRHIDKLHAPITVTYGTLETPDFQRQSRDFAAAVKVAGKPVQVIEAPNYHHLEMAESLGNPYGPNGRAALALMKLAPA